MKTHRNIEKNEDEQAEIDNSFLHIILYNL
jgi:hypothetical protein